MKKGTKMARTITIISALLVTAVFLYTCQKKETSQPLDKDGMERDFAKERLYGKWIVYAEDDPSSLLFFISDEFTLTDSQGDSQNYSYSVSSFSDFDHKHIFINGTLPEEFQEFEYRIRQAGNYEIGVLFALELLDGGEPPVRKIFVKENDSYIIPKGTVFSLSEDTIEENDTDIYHIDDALGCLYWLGRTYEEIGISENELNTYGDLDFTSFLFAETVEGSCHSADTIYDISLYSYDLDMERCSEGFSKLYGEPETGEEPYAAVNGGAVYWERFDADPYYIHISQGSENDWIQIRFKLKDSPH